MKQILQRCVQASMHGQESMYNGAFVYVHMCCVVNLYQLCMAVSLTSDHCAGANEGCRLEDREAWRSQGAGTS